MSWLATAYVKTLSVAPSGEPITRSEKLLLMILADYHNAEEKVARPSVASLARDAMMSERRIQQLLRSTERKEIIRTERRIGQNSLYRFPELEYFADCLEQKRKGRKNVGSETAISGEGRNPELQGDEIAVSLKPSVNLKWTSLQSVVRRCLCRQSLRSLNRAAGAGRY